MIGSVFIKTLYQKRWSTLAWSIGMFILVLLTMVFYPSFKQGSFDQVLKSVPPSLQQLIGDPAAYKTLGGYIGQEVFALRAPLLSLVLVVILFTGITAGDEDRGVTAEELTLPIPRWRLLSEKVAAVLVIIGIVHLAAIVAIVVSFPIVHESVSVWRISHIVGLSYFLTVTAGMISFALGAATGSRSLASGGGAFIFASYFVTTLAPSVDKLKGLEHFSLFHYYQEPKVSLTGIVWSDLAVLIAVGLVLWLIGTWIFARRDLLN